MLGVVGGGGTEDLAVRNGGPPRVVTSGSGTAALKCLWMLPVESCSPHTHTLGGDAECLTWVSVYVCV